MPTPLRAPTRYCLHYRHRSDGVRGLLLTNPSPRIHHLPKYEVLDTKTTTYDYVVERSCCVLPDTNKYMLHFRDDNISHRRHISHICDFGRVWEGS